MKKPIAAMSKYQAKPITLVNPTVTSAGIIAQQPTHAIAASQAKRIGVCDFTGKLLMSG